MMNGNNTVTRQFGALMERYDALLTPTLAIRVPEANGPYSLLRDEALDPWMNRLDGCLPLHHAGQRDRAARHQHPGGPGP